MRRSKGYITRQAQRLADGEINRRRFVMSALSAGVTMPTALSLASKAAASPPRPGGVLRIATGNASDGMSQLLNLATGNCLTERTAQGDLVGELAESFEASDDQTIWRFQLRGDAAFQNGQDISAEHVAATLENTKGFLPPISSVRTDGSKAVVVSLARPDPSFADRLADPRFVITSQDGVETTGGYRLEHREAGRVILRRVSDYWKPDRAYFEAVEITSLPDIAARQSALMAGDVDYADQIDPRGLALLQRAPGIRILEQRNARVLVLSSKNAASLEDIAPAIPYQALVDRILLGHGMPAVGAPERALSRPPGVVSLAVHDAGVPRTLEVAKLISEQLERHAIQTRIVSPDATDPRAIHIKWQRSREAGGSDMAQLVALWASDFAAHADSLAHRDVATDQENDGARLIERWWFT